MNFEPSFCTPRLYNLCISSLLKSTQFPLTNTFFPSLSTRLAKNSFTKAAQPGSLCSPSDCHSLFSIISAKGEISFLNLLSAMKPLSFKLLSIRASTLSEIKLLTLSLLCFASVSSVPLFYFSRFFQCLLMLFIFIIPSLNLLSYCSRNLFYLIFQLNVLFQYFVEVWNQDCGVRHGRVRVLEL